MRPVFQLTKIHDMTVAITGASKGLGRAMAVRFAKEGHDLLLCARGEAALRETKTAIETAFPGVGCEVFTADLSRQAEAKAFAEWCSGMAVPDILVNNAGSFVPGSLAEEADGLLETMLAVNLYSAYWLTRALLPGMKAKGGGHIFNICSVASLQAYPGGGSYSISKYALLGFSKNLREELKPFQIKVTSVMPGAAFTDSWIGSGIDPHRIMEANDIAEMVVAATKLSARADVEEIVLRPLLGDL